ncbi:MAG TPA: alpha-ketoglutarate-dependent dioxygenase AlkB [Polyangiaceae bacterium]
MQLSLFGRARTRWDSAFARVQRRPLAQGAWVDTASGWLEGHAALFEELVREAPWVGHHRLMYDRYVAVPRLVAAAPEGPARRTLNELAECLSDRYRLDLGQVSLAYYRDGNDSVALHGDKLGKLVDDTVVAIVSVGAPRRFLLKSALGGPSRTLLPGWGDLLVMGGSCQRTWLHGVPKAVRAEPRIAIMFRPSAAV